jgi:hypothetical protein
MSTKRHTIVFMSAALILQIGSPAIGQNSNQAFTGQAQNKTDPSKMSVDQLKQAIRAIIQNPLGGIASSELTSDERRKLLEDTGKRAISLALILKQKLGNDYNTDKFYQAAVTRIHAIDKEVKKLKAAASATPAPQPQPSSQPAQSVTENDMNITGFWDLSQKLNDGATVRERYRFKLDSSGNYYDLINAASERKLKAQTSGNELYIFDTDENGEPLQSPESSWSYNETNERFKMRPGGKVYSAGVGHTENVSTFLQKPTPVGSWTRSGADGQNNFVFRRVGKDAYAGSLGPSSPSDEAVKRGFKPNQLSIPALNRKSDTEFTGSIWWQWRLQPGQSDEDRRKEKHEYTLTINTPGTAVDNEQNTYNRED